MRQLPTCCWQSSGNSVSNLIRRAEKHLAQSRQDRNVAARIVETITKTENRV
jgi:hypothetical protein